MTASTGRKAVLGSELLLELLDLTRSALALPVGRWLPDARECPADRFGPVDGDTRGDQGVDDFDLFLSEARHYRHNGPRLEGDGARATQSDRAANVSVANDELDGPDLGDQIGWPG